MGSTDDQERSLHNQVVKVAEVLGIGGVPAQLEDYDGWFQEARKRVQMRSLRRTRKEALALLEQATAAHRELLALRRTQAELGRLDKENLVKDLELEKQQHGLILDIEKHKKALRELNEPPSPKQLRTPWPAPRKLSRNEVESVA
ncbi:hypothetical protein [Candidatus Binatus sp.]|uniref:hypothetical protein n=1 Tax=Candidatus Binatus sp. TaxID=2811406 RepID=UPI002F950F49